MGDHEESISARDFERLCKFIYEECGIVLNAEKKTMLELRIKKRLKSLNLASFDQYVAYLFSARGQREEIVRLIDVVSTNKTDFFREPEHFDFLAKKAGCSTGEEPYTLAMVLRESIPAGCKLGFKILATDISLTVLAKAERGMFDKEVMRPVPQNLLRKYFMRSRDPDSKVVRVVPELRELVEFRRLNFMDGDFGMTQKFDVIFCRNVLIYFDRPTQERIVRKLAGQLVTGGYAFVGHSESLHDMDIPLMPVAPALYRKVHGRA
jgi:chemotaxis protein methyltransferase CheR